jgi:hypothetical protein
MNANRRSIPPSTRKVYLMVGVLLACLMSLKDRALTQRSTNPDLSGEWRVTYDSGAFGCATISFTVRKRNAADLDLVEAVEERRCFVPEERLLRLNYLGSIFQRDDMLLLALRPPMPEDSNVKAVELIDPRLTDPKYTPNRLTFWASRDRYCNLSGWRRDNLQRFHVLTIQKLDCADK